MFYCGTSSWCKMNLITLVCQNVVEWKEGKQVLSNKEHRCIWSYCSQDRQSPVCRVQQMIDCWEQNYQLPQSVLTGLDGILDSHVMSNLFSKIQN